MWPRSARRPMLPNQHTRPNCALCTAQTVQQTFRRGAKKIYCRRLQCRRKCGQGIRGLSMLGTALRRLRVEQSSIESSESRAGHVTRNWRLAGLTLAASLLAASGAQAQNCGPLVAPAPYLTNFIGLFGSAISAGATISSQITAAN